MSNNVSTVIVVLLIDCSILRMSNNVSATIMVLLIDYSIEQYFTIIILIII